MPWGGWATMGWVLLIGFVHTVAQGVVMFGAAYGLFGPELPDNIATHGLILAIAVCVAAPVAAGLAVALAWARGFSAREYLRLARPRPRDFIVWTVLLLLAAAAMDLLTIALSRPVVPEFMIEVYESAGFLPLLWFALIVVAPVTEEIVFRGFMFTGLENLKIGPRGAILVTAVCFAIIHLQYDLYGIVLILVIGLLLGLARWKTGSLWVCIWLHAVLNTVATIQAHYAVARIE
jgi:uncharacterized protein